MYTNKTVRLFLASLLLASVSFSSLVLSPVRAETSSSVTLSPAIVAQLDAFIVKVQALRSKYPSDADWGMFIDKLSGKIIALKPRYIENPLIIAVLNRLNSGVNGLKVQETVQPSISTTIPINTPPANTTAITSGPPYHCSGLYGLPEMEQYANDLETRVALQYRTYGIYTMDEIKQDTAKFRPDHAIEIDGTQIQAGTLPAVRCKGTKSNARTTPLPTSPYQGSKCIIQDVTWSAANAKGNTTFPNPQHLLPKGSAFAFRYTPPVLPVFSLLHPSYPMGYTYISLSENPCDFSAELEAKGCGGLNDRGAESRVRYATSDFPGLSEWIKSQKTNPCILDPGKTYYFNVRGAQTWNGPDDVSAANDNNTFWIHY